MKLLVGLGNPGKEYVSNRHNLGHLFVDYLRKRKRKDALKSVKTTVFMNQSGEEVQKLLNKFRLSPSQLLVAHDDMDLPLGEVKLQFGRGSAGHRGVESILSSLGTKDFWRLRLGIGKPPEEIEGEEFVLADFTKEEARSLEKVFSKSLELLEEYFVRDVR